jgi:hypothetical protein
MANIMRLNQLVPIETLANANLTDGYIKLGSMKVEDDGTLTYSIIVFASKQDALQNVNEVFSKAFNMSAPGLRVAIKNDLLSRPYFDLSTDEPA